MLLIPLWDVDLDKAYELQRSFPPEENGFVYEIEDFIRGVREGRLESDVIPHRDTLLCMELFDLCDRENPQEK